MMKDSLFVAQMHTIQNVVIILIIRQIQMWMKNFQAEVSVLMTQGITPPLYTQVICVIMAL